MLRYLYTKELFSEIPQEITLGISISGCRIHCYGCHSRELWEDKGTVLDVEELKRLLDEHSGISCVCLFGGEHDIDTLTELFMYAHKRVKTAWYCGLDMVPRDKVGILDYLDYYKIGHFDLELGGLSEKTTNQKLFKLEHRKDGTCLETDITYLLQKN